MRKQVTAFILCVCLMIAGISWNVSAKSVQETEAAVTPEDTEKTEDLTENTGQEEPLTKGRAAEYAGTVIASEDDTEILHSGTWNGITWSLDSNGKLMLDGSLQNYGSVSSTPWWDYSDSIVSAEVKGSGWKSASSLFLGCSNLAWVDMSNWDASSVMDMNYIFYGCSSLVSIHVPRHISVSAELPLTTGYIWQLPDGTKIKTLPQNLDASVMITKVSGTYGNQPEIVTTTQDLNMSDIVRVKYVPYSYTLETDSTDEENQVTFSLAEGRLPEGLQIYPATGEIYGVPVEAGEFPITVKATYSNPDFEPSFAKLTVTVLDSTDNNVYNASDLGYEVIVPLGEETEAGSNIYMITQSGDQLFVSKGEMREFVGLWLNGQKLEEAKDYSVESGSTRITVYGETLENKADRDGVNTIAAEFRVDGDQNNSLRRTAQNFRLALGGSTGNTEKGSQSVAGKNDSVYRVIAPHTDDDANSGRLVMAVLFGGMGAALCLCGKKMRKRTELLEY